MIKATLFANNIIKYIENPKDSTDNLLEWIREFKEVGAYKKTMYKINCIPIHQQKQLEIKNIKTIHSGTKKKNKHKGINVQTMCMSVSKKLSSYTVAK